MKYNLRVGTSASEANSADFRTACLFIFLLITSHILAVPTSGAIVSVLIPESTRILKS